MGITQNHCQRLPASSPRGGNEGTWSDIEEANWVLVTQSCHRVASPRSRLDSGGQNSSKRVGAGSRRGTGRRGLLCNSQAALGPWLPDRP